MRSVLSRVRLAMQRGLARADTWVGVVALWLGGMSAGNGRWVAGAALGLVGVVFVVASGDYSWRKGFVAGKRHSVDDA
ncbi:MAG TPA: hypothetical protein VMN58_07570 [Acidimicrobiales bacterium]|nr:hypothetical protein [Acidimicrobiales bacterium]